MGLLSRSLTDEELNLFISNSKKTSIMSFLKNLWNWLFGGKKQPVVKIVEVVKDSEIDFPSSVAPTITPTILEEKKPTAKTSAKLAAKSSTKKPAAKNGKGKK